MLQTKTLTEVVFVAHLQAPLNMTVLDFATWTSAFAEFRVHQQTLPQQPPQLQAQVNSTIKLGNSITLPRLVLRSAQSPYLLQMQVDRFAFSWANKGELNTASDYPGYIKLLAEFTDMLQRHAVWCKSALNSPLEIKMIELFYQNSLPLERSVGLNWRMSEVFAFLKPWRTINSLSINWSELLDSGPDAPRVTVQAGLGQAAQIDKPIPSLRNAFIFNFDGLARFPTTVPFDSPVIVEMLNRLHDRIVDVYEASITSEARC